MFVESLTYFFISRKQLTSKDETNKTLQHKTFLALSKQLRTKKQTIAFRNLLFLNLDFFIKLRRRTKIHIHDKHWKHRVEKIKLKMHSHKERGREGGHKGLLEGRREIRDSDGRDARRARRFIKLKPARIIGSRGNRNPFLTH